MLHMLLNVSIVKCISNNDSKFVTVRYHIMARLSELAVTQLYIDE